MKILEEEGKIVFYPTGHINTDNAAVFEKEATEAISGHPGMEPVIDAAGLEYISSAGLRALMRIRKSEGALTVRNVSSELYETFDITGFTSLLNVQKALRFISVEGLEQIGAGAHSAVYRLDEESILKVVKDMTPDAIRAEMQVAKQVFVHGIPTAISYDMVRTEEGYGEVFEMVRADTLPAVIMADTEHIDKYLKEFVDLYHAVHEVEIGEGELESVRDHYLDAEKEVAGYLTEEEHLLLRKFFLTMPEKHNFVHGDLHMNNVMLQDGELVLIDMGEAGWGSPLLDYAQTAQAYNGVLMFVPERCRQVLGLEIEQAAYIRDHFFPMYFGENDPALDRKLEIVEALFLTRSFLIPFIQGWGYVQHNYDELIERARKYFFPKVDHFCEIIRAEFQ